MKFHELVVAKHHWFIKYAEKLSSGHRTVGYAVIVIVSGAIKSRSDFWIGIADVALPSARHCRQSFDAICLVTNKLQKTCFAL